VSKALVRVWVPETRSGAFGRCLCRSSGVERLLDCLLGVEVVDHVVTVTGAMPVDRGVRLCQ
jgi:hypothetical protein